MIDIQCNSCKSIAKIWPYKMKKLKNVETYLCSSCRKKDSYIEKICPICKNIYSGRKCDINNNKTCSYSCSNKLFRTGVNNGNWKTESYRSTCFLSHKKECVICGEKNLVEVHHFDEDHSNNNIENLIPVCPTHHKYLHSKFKEKIIDAIIKYRNSFIENNLDKF